jgi:serine/threonine-protein kinase
MPPERVVFILGQVLDSLDDAHSRGLVHRDIKPANILICRKGRQYDFVKVVDFGLVRITADSEAAAAKITETGEGKILGTPAYLAPESITGSDPVDGRSDLYAVGCVAYFLLTAHNVFEANSAMSMAVAHATEPPKPPSSRGVQLPEALDALILRCLAKRPGERPESACSLARELAKVPLARRWDNDRARDWWNGHLPDQAQIDVDQTVGSEAPTAIIEPMLSA